ncbi:MAG: putative metal-binding motif-containing protein [Myxococcales bacterium]|nr:putative metal-binding motif-containing protein [Myxococcales bacterium]
MGGDCDDADPAAHPGGTEVCGGGDEDCDGSVDEAAATGQTTFYRDADGDTYGDPSVTTMACATPAGFVDRAADCWDESTGGDVHPGADYQSVPFCRTGSLCMYSSGGVRSWRCPPGLTCTMSGPTAGWDYDCSTVVEVEPQGTACSSPPGGRCVGGVGPQSAHPPSSCGQDVTYITGCRVVSGACTTATATMPLRCR